MKHSTEANRILRLLFWESTIRCNLSCAHCRRLDTNEAVGKDLSTEQAKDLVRQLAELGGKQSFNPILVFSGGEPLCREDLFELITYAGSLSITPALATNGTLIDAEVAEKIKDNGVVRVAVSLDGATGRVHNKLRKLDGCFEKALEGISHLREKDIPFQINITLTRHNAHQLEDVYELAKRCGAVAVHIFMLVPVGCGQVLADTDMLSPKEYEDMLVKISQLDRLGEIQIKVTCGPHYERVIREQGLYQTRKGAHHDDNVPGRGRHGAATKGCLAGLGVLFAGHQGDVFPCGYLPVNCGNVLEEGPVDIWHNNKDLARMRNSSGLEGKCGICGYRQICGGCRARAYAATGNYMAEEPFCAYIPPEAAGSL